MGTINRFLPSSQENQNAVDGYGAPNLSGQQGQNVAGNQAGQNFQSSQTGDRRTSNTGNSFAAQGVQPGLGANGYPFSATGSNDFEENFNFADTLICPGGSVEACIKVGPGNTAPLYGGCVQGCADRCDSQGQGSQFGQQGNPGQNGQSASLGRSNQAGSFGPQSQNGGRAQGQYGQQNV